jgi:2-polyprenyl-3-methyl-5-hydroxy-6-metoxy-1,4-benzoquinol methylase
MNLKNRSYQKELLDENDIPAGELRKNLKELNFINTWLGGHSITIEGVKHLINPEKEVVICEIGCGGGDNIFALHKWCSQKGIKVTFIGIDIKPECIAFAKEKSIEGNFTWLVSDYSKVQFLSKPDIIFSSLFCHHFTEEQLIFQLKWMKENCSIGFFINDLHRHWLAYQSIKLLTSIFSTSYLVKNDAPLSVTRGFVEDDWKILLDKALIEPYKIIWKWAFRHLVIYKHE